MLFTFNTALVLSLSAELLKLNFASNWSNLITNRHSWACKPTKEGSLNNFPASYLSTDHVREIAEQAGATRHESEINIAANLRNIEILWRQMPSKQMLSIDTWCGNNETKQFLILRCVLRKCGSDSGGRVTCNECFIFRDWILEEREEIVLGKCQVYVNSLDEMIWTWLLQCQCQLTWS